jgi:hypothetical protein
MRSFIKLKGRERKMEGRLEGKRVMKNKFACVHMCLYFYLIAQVIENL